MRRLREDFREPWRLSGRQLQIKCQPEFAEPGQVLLPDAVLNQSTATGF